MAKSKFSRTCRLPGKLAGSKITMGFESSGPCLELRDELKQGSHIPEVLDASVESGASAVEELSLVLMELMESVEDRIEEEVSGGDVLIEEEMEAVSLGEEEDVSEDAASEVDVPESVVDSRWLED